MSATDNDIKQLLNQGLGVQKIKAQLGVGQARIQKVKDEMGISSTKNNPNRPATYTRPKSCVGIPTSIPESIPEESPSIPEYTCLPEPEPAAKPDVRLEQQFSHLEIPTQKLDSPGMAATTSPSLEVPSSFSGARAGFQVPVLQQQLGGFTVTERLEAQIALKAILKRSKQAIGYSVQPGLEIAKKIIDKLLE